MGVTSLIFFENLLSAVGGAVVADDDGEGKVAFLTDDGIDTLPNPMLLVVRNYGANNSGVCDVFFGTDNHGLVELFVG